MGLLFSYTESCPATSTQIVSLSSSFEQDGRQSACPGECVTFTCEVNQSATIQIAAEDFICRNDPVTFVASDSIGSSSGGDIFKANLTNVERESSQALYANFTVTLKANTTGETNNTVVECADRLTSDLVQRKTLTQSCKTKIYNKTRVSSKHRHS